MAGLAIRFGPDDEVARMPVKGNQVALRAATLRTGVVQPRQLCLDDGLNLAAQRSGWHIPRLLRHLVQHRLQRVGRVDERVPLRHIGQEPHAEVTPK